MTFISDLNINITALRIKTGEKLNKLYADIGDKSLLLTSNKTSLVNAINELYTNSDGFVKKIGDTMTGSLNMIGSASINFNNEIRLRNSSTSSILSARTTEDNNVVGIFLRPQGDTSSTGQVQITHNGFIKTSNHGDSSQWKLAYDRGDFREFGLGRYSTPALTLATLPKSTGFYFVNEADNIFIGINSKQAKVLRLSNSTFSAVDASFILSHNGNEIGYRYSDTANIVRIWHDGNLTKLSQLQDDLRFGSNYVLFSNNNDLTNHKYYTSKSGIDANTILGNVAFYTSNNSVNTNNYYHHQSWALSDAYGYQLRKHPESSGGYAIRTRNNGNWLPWENIAYESFVTSLLQNYYTKTETVNQFVGVSNVQTIGGTKTFSNSPIVPNATLASHALNKGQMESWISTQGFIQSLSLGNTFGSIKLSGSNSQVSLNNLSLKTRLNANVRETGPSFTPYITGANHINYPQSTTSAHVGLRLEHGVTSQSLGFDIHHITGDMDVLYYKTFNSSQEGNWQIFASRDWVNTRLDQGADSIWEHTPQGGLRIRNYNSLATRDGAIAITKGGGATKINAIGIGTSVNSDGNDGLVIGPLSSNLGIYGTVVGPYSSNTPMEGTVIGAFLLNNQRGCTVTGRYNDPILSTTTNTVTDNSPLFIIGNGKHASIRSNAYVMQSDGLGEFQNKQKYSSNITQFSGKEIPTAEWVLANGGGSNGAEDYISNYGSQISQFSETTANLKLGTSPLKASGEILGEQDIIGYTAPTIVYLSSDGKWRKWNDSSNGEGSNIVSTAALGISVSNKEVMIRGYYHKTISPELSTIMNSTDLFHVFNKGSLGTSNSTSNVERVFGYRLKNNIGYFNPWMFK